MPARAPPTGKATATKLAGIGARLRAHRKALGVTATVAAEAAGMSRVTLHRIEGGEPSVTMAAYMSAAESVGLAFDLIDHHMPRNKGTLILPKRISLVSYPQLKRIAWQLGDIASLTPREALSLYERNWRHVDTAALSEDERDLVRHLVSALGGAALV